MVWFRRVQKLRIFVYTHFTFHLYINFVIYNYVYQHGSKIWRKYWNENNVICIPKHLRSCTRSHHLCVIISGPTVLNDMVWIRRVQKLRIFMYILPILSVWHIFVYCNRYFYVIYTISIRVAIHKFRSSHPTFQDVGVEIFTPMYTHKITRITIGYGTAICTLFSNFLYHVNNTPKYMLNYFYLMSIVVATMEVAVV